MIDKIKLKGFEKYKNKIGDKISEKKKYKMIIQNLQKQLGVSNRHCCVQETKYIMNQMQNFCQGYRRQIYFMSKELPIIKKEIEDVLIPNIDEYTM
jgi:hypothetical protein